MFHFLGDVPVEDLEFLLRLLLVDDEQVDLRKEPERRNEFVDVGFEHDRVSGPGLALDLEQHLKFDAVAIAKDD
jgi:hypothetical protein